MHRHPAIGTRRFSSAPDRSQHLIDGRHRIRLRDKSYNPDRARPTPSCNTRNSSEASGRRAPLHYIFHFPLLVHLSFCFSWDKFPSLRFLLSIVLVILLLPLSLKSFIAPPVVPHFRLEPSSTLRARSSICSTPVASFILFVAFRFFPNSGLLYILPTLHVLTSSFDIDLIPRLPLVSHLLSRYAPRRVPNLTCSQSVREPLVSLVAAGAH